jgi:hypothetical protein
MFWLAQAAYDDKSMETYGYMTDSELNLAEEVRQQYRISDEDIRTLVELMAVAIKAERDCNILMKRLQDSYHLSPKHLNQLRESISTLCFFPHRAVVDTIGADGTHGNHPVHESIIFKTLQEFHLLPPGRPAYKKPSAASVRSLRAALAEVLQNTPKKPRKAS